jgi:uncharacterized protein YceK
MRKILLACLLAVAFAGCATIAKLTDSAAERAGKAIAEYCKLPADQRLQFGALLVKHAAPNSAQINCATSP